MKKTGAQILVDALVREGTEVMFGYPGGVVIPIFDVLYDAQRSSSADRATSRAPPTRPTAMPAPPARSASAWPPPGPGATNLVTGIATAYMDSIPMVAITGQVKTAADRQRRLPGSRHHRHHPADHQAQLTWSRTSRTCRGSIKEAFYIAATGRPGPVLIDLPDVSQAMLDKCAYPETVSIRSATSPTRRAIPGRSSGPPRRSTAPRSRVIYVGGGVHRSRARTEELRELAEKTNIPVTTTLHGAGRLSRRPSAVARDARACTAPRRQLRLHECDLIIAVGARFDDRVTGKWRHSRQNAKVIHIDIDPAAISKIIQVDIPVVGDAKSILAELNKLVASRDAPTRGTRRSKSWPKSRFVYNHAIGRRDQAAVVIEELYELTEGDAIVATEVGQHQMWTAQYYNFTPSRARFISSGGLGTMGFGLPAAIGAQLGCPDTRSVVDIAGDGSIQMNIQELATACRSTAFR